MMMDRSILPEVELPTRDQNLFSSSITSCSVKWVTPARVWEEKYEKHDKQAEQDQARPGRMLGCRGWTPD